MLAKGSNWIVIWTDVLNATKKRGDNVEGRNTSNEVCLIVKYCCELRPVV